MESYFQASDNRQRRAVILVRETHKGKYTHPLLFLNGESRGHRGVPERSQFGRLLLTHLHQVITGRS